MLDPGLESPPVSNFDTEKDSSALNLNLCCSELAPLRSGQGLHLPGGERGKAVQVDIMLTLC